MNLTKKQRNFLLWCGAIVVAWYVLRSIVTSAQQAAYYRQQAMRAAQRQKAKPKPSVSTAKPSAQAGAPAPTVQLPDPPSFAKVTGIWKGHAAIPEKGVCDLRFELSKKADEPGKFSGYSALTCLAVGPLVRRGRGNGAAIAINHMDPEAAIFTGTADKVSIQFQVDKVVGADASGCAPTSFTLTPFGANRLAAEWQEGSCAGGHMILGKATP